MIIPIVDKDDVRLNAYRFVRERDVVGRGDHFIAEGKVVLSCLVDAQDFEAESLLVLEGRLNGIMDIVDRFASSVPVYVANRQVLDAVAGFQVHRGILASGNRTSWRTCGGLIQIMPDDALVIVLSGISNHDNVGSIFRNAAAFGADAVILDEQCCNPLYRKALRVSVGGVLKTPWAIGGTIETIAKSLAETGFSLSALSTSGTHDIREVPVSGRRALFLGSEGHGLPQSVLQAMKTYRIPIKPGFDSLNVATASGIAMMLATAAPQMSGT